MHTVRLLVLSALTLLLVAACGGPESPAEQEAAQQPSATVIASATALQPTATMLPDATASPTPQPETQTPTTVAPAATPTVEPAAPSATPEPPTSTPPPLEPSATPEPPPTATPVPEPTATPEPPVAVAEDLAPALGSIDSWHNSGPLALTDLIGSPVLLVFWADY